MLINKLAQKSKVNIKTVRYYEKRGLIPEPPRTESGYREFPKEIIARIQFIKRSQELGFTLKEISELLSLRVDPDTSCKDIKQRTISKIKNVEEKIKDLQKIKKALSNLSLSCSGEGSLSECPILEALNTKEVNDNET